MPTSKALTPLQSHIKAKSALKGSLSLKYVGDNTVVYNYYTCAGLLCCRSLQREIQRSGTIGILSRYQLLLLASASQQKVGHLPAIIIQAQSLAITIQ